MQTDYVHLGTRAGFVSKILGFRISFLAHYGLVDAPPYTSEAGAEPGSIKRAFKISINFST